MAFTNPGVALTTTGTRHGTQKCRNLETQALHAGVGLFFIHNHVAIAFSALLQPVMGVEECNPIPAVRVLAKEA